jgi:propanol-preferring alcohol dehydrogenase
MGTSIMQAFQLVSAGTTELREVPVPEPGPGEVLVKVGAAGACHSDLHLMHAPAEAVEAFPVPFTLGHENAGWVEALGPGVGGWEPGEPVAIYGIVGCGRCRSCLAGRPNACLTVPPGGIGLSRDGGMASHVSVPAEQLVPIGDLDVTQAAPLTDAGLTPYHAIRVSRDGLGPGSTCVVIGVGGLGHMAIQILSALTAARIIAVDVDERQLSMAQEVGAHETVRSDAEAAAAIRELVGPPPGGADVVLDNVSVDPTLQLGASVIATGGWLMLVGLGGGTLPLTVGLAPTIPLEARLTIPFWGTRAELVEVVALARAGLISAHVERFELADAATAYERLEGGELAGRAVVIPS